LGFGCRASRLGEKAEILAVCGPTSLSHMDPLLV
jgi:hypothetical protein